MMKIKNAVSEIKKAIGSYKGKLVGETIVYGFLAAIYTSLFFFGALYPKYGLPSQSIMYEGQEESGKHETPEEFDRDSTEEIVYKSLILERIKEWF